MPADPIARAVALHADAARLREAGEHRPALRAGRRAADLFARHEGPGHPDVAAALLEVGAALELHERWREALLSHRNDMYPRTTGHTLAELAGSPLVRCNWG